MGGIGEQRSEEAICIQYDSKVQETSR